MTKHCNLTAGVAVEHISVSACAIMKNELTNAPAWLENVREFADEIVVADTGSTDGTREFLQKQPDVVLVDYKWNNDFAAAKNKVLELATGDWIAFTDADEIFINPKCLRQWLMEQQKCFAAWDAVFVPLYNVDADKGDSLIEKNHVVRVFRNKRGLLYRGTVHEQLTAPGRDLSYAHGDESLAVRHIGYSSSIIYKKNQRNFALLKQEIEQGSNPEAYYGFMSECCFGMQKYDDAFRYAMLAHKSPYRAITGKNDFYEIAINSLKKLDLKLAERLSRAEIDEFCCNVLQYNKWHSYALTQWVDTFADLPEKVIVEKLKPFYFESDRDVLRLSEILAENGFVDISCYICREYKLWTDDIKKVDEVYNAFQQGRGEEILSTAASYTLLYTNLLAVSLLEHDLEEDRKSLWLEEQIRFLPDDYKKLMCLYYGRKEKYEIDFSAYLHLLKFVIAYNEGSVLERYLGIASGLDSECIIQIGDQLLDGERYALALEQYGKIQAGDAAVTGEFWLKCGKCFYFLNDCENAMAAFEESGRLQPDSRELAAYMTWCRERRQNENIGMCDC